MFKAIAHQQGVSASEVKERIQSTICIYHKHDCRRTIAAISDALPDMDAAMRPLAEQTIHKLQNITDAAFEEAQFTMRRRVKDDAGAAADDDCCAPRFLC